MKYAPIIVFAFNRLEPLKACIESLKLNSEYSKSDLFIFVDGPRKDKISEAEKVEKVKSYASSIEGFKSLNTSFSNINKKLAPSIIAGVTEVIDKYGKAIVIEDDLVVGKNFLAFMNEGLNIYENEKRVFSICGYTNRINKPMKYQYDAYFAPRSSSWGWATWKDRWLSVDWNLYDWEVVEDNARLFNKWGGSDCYGMLKGWKYGKNNSWAIRFCYSQFVQNKVSVFPIISHVNNNGFDGDGTNCKKWSRFKFDFDTSEFKTFNFPINVEINKKLVKSALSYHTLLLRAFSRFMYIFYDIKDLFKKK